MILADSRQFAIRRSLLQVLSTYFYKIFTHPLRVCKVLVINRKNILSGELRFPTVRDSEIAPTSFIYIFLQNIYTPPDYFLTFTIEFLLFYNIGGIPNARSFQ